MTMTAMTMKMMRQTNSIAAWGLLGCFALSLLTFSVDAGAHGERAQLASMRMRTLHWFDISVSPTRAKVGDTIVMTGKFVPSELWPEQLPSITDTVFLNIGAPGPKFIRVYSEVNGVPMIRSTAFEPGKVYDFKIVVRARIPGRYHIHPLLNVKDAGTLVGKGTWVEIEPSATAATFTNEITTLTGETVDLESVGLKAVVGWHLVWIAMGVAFLVYWLMKPELFIPRYMRVRNLGPEQANAMITKRDFLVGGFFFTATTVLILAGYLWAEHRYPVTIPLQTGKVKVEGAPVPKGPLKVAVENANYELAGRSLTMRMSLSNHGDQPLTIKEFVTANIRFLNGPASDAKVVEGEELVAGDSLHPSVSVIEPGQSIDVVIRAEDSLWETQRMTGLIYDPDSRFAGLLFYEDAKGVRYYQEVGGAILPKFF
jgi:methane/ammonia monooxygenase subunit B